MLINSCDEKLIVLYIIDASFLSNYRLTVFSQTNRCGGIGKTYEYCIDKVRRQPLICTTQNIFQ